MLKIQRVICSLIVSAGGVLAQQPATNGTEVLRTLNFLEGTWEAKAVGDPSAKTAGTYTFGRELGGHVLARHSTQAGCETSAASDCDHRDLFYVYPGIEGQPLKRFTSTAKGT